MTLTLFSFSVLATRSLRATKIIVCETALFYTESTDTVSLVKITSLHVHL